MDERGVDKARCAELIAADIVENNNTVRYPSTLGINLDSQTQVQLVLYLVNKHFPCKE